MISKLGVIGLGEAGSAFCSTLAVEENVALHAYDLRLEDSLFRRSLADRLPNEVNLVRSPRELFSVADYVFSLVTAEASLQVAQTAAEIPCIGTTLLDGNSVSPQTAREAASIAERSGCRFVDLALMASVTQWGHKVPMLASGREAASIAESLEPLGFQMKVVGEGPGVASAAKMMRSVIVKGVESLLIESLAAASAYGVAEHVLDSLDESFPEGTWRERADYFAKRTVKHGVRRAVEMEHAAGAIADLGIEPLLASASAQRLRQVALLIDGTEGDSFDYVRLSEFVASGLAHD